MGLYKRDIFCYNATRSTQYGPVVQSVSTPACHAGGRRFESVRGRHKKKNHPFGWFFLFMKKQRTDSNNSNATVRWTVACARLDGRNTLIFANGENANESVRDFLPTDKRVRSGSPFFQIPVYRSVQISVTRYKLPYHCEARRAVAISRLNVL